MGVLQSANPFILSVNMGINAGVVGVTFFGGSRPKPSGVKLEIAASWLDDRLNTTCSLHLHVQACENTSSHHYCSPDEQRLRIPADSPSSLRISGASCRCRCRSRPPRPPRPPRPSRSSGTSEF